MELLKAIFWLKHLWKLSVSSVCTHGSIKAYTMTDVHHILIIEWRSERA